MWQVWSDLTSLFDLQITRTLCPFVKPHCDGAFNWWAAAIYFPCLVCWKLKEEAYKDLVCSHNQNFSPNENQRIHGYPFCLLLWLPNMMLLIMWMSLYFHLHRGRQLSRQSFSVSQDTTCWRNVAVCDPDHFQMWSEWSDVNATLVHLGCIHTCT